MEASDLVAVTGWGITLLWVGAVVGRRLERSDVFRPKKPDNDAIVAELVECARSVTTLSKFLGRGMGYKKTAVLKVDDKEYDVTVSKRGE